MEDFVKRKKITRESTITDIAATISEISESLTSMSESYRGLLKVNKALVLYIQNAKKRKDANVNGLENSLNRTSIQDEAE